MAYRLGARSRTRLEGVHPDLVRVVGAAIQLTRVDFTVLEGMRSLERQKQLVAAGASQTLNSRHLTGHAVDLGAWVGGAVRWDWPLYYPIAEAMREASLSQGVPIRWGGCWQELAAVEDPEAAVADYAARCRREGRRGLADGPHFELPRAAYP